MWCVCCCGRIVRTLITDASSHPQCIHFFCPAPQVNKPAPRVLDPSGGGPTRGFVAASRGMEFTGIELRKEQVAANIEMSHALLDGAPKPHYVLGDGRRAMELLPGKQESFDMILMCMPYYKLEKYSDLVDDLSNCASPDAFNTGLCALVAAACPVRALNGRGLHGLAR